MQTKLLNVLLLLVFVIGIFGAGELVYNEISQHNVCPKLLGIPACYIILTCFIIPFVVHIFKARNYIYFAFTGFAFVIALVATIMQFTGHAECPKTASGTPMCYYSLALFTSLIVLKWLFIKHASKNL
jgi:hypothetical protein